jgi:hypothetical protein
MKNYMIATAKRIADIYGGWVEQGYEDRQERLDRMLAKIQPQKIKDKARSIIKHRYNE